jgi:hypothetical protein
MDEKRQQNAGSRWQVQQPCPERLSICGEGGAGEALEQQAVSHRPEKSSEVTRSLKTRTWDLMKTGTPQ